jgi:glycosyltransferase involved in cell wall biosynthesis
MDHRHYWNGQKIWDGKITKPVEKQYKISLCTTCMDRLSDLSQTMPFNLGFERYPNVEFVLLDYGSKKDDVSNWVRLNLGHYIERGRLNFYRTSEPAHYSMGISRNIAFKVATGDIVVNVDADNYTIWRDAPDKDRPAYTFCEYLNVLANQCNGEKGIFAKGKRLLRGRLGLFRKEFIEELGGYDEEMIGYGYDDIDLLRRGWALGYEMYWFGGVYIERIKTSSGQKGENMPIKNWKQTEKMNQELGYKKLEEGILKANEGKHWGKAHLLKNFKEEIDI